MINPSAEALSNLWIASYADYETWKFYLRGTTESRRSLLASYYPSYARSLINKPGYRCYGETIVDGTSDSTPDDLSCSTCSQSVSPPSQGWLVSLMAAAKREIQISIETVAVIPVVGVKAALRLRLYSRGGKRLQRRFVAARYALLGSHDSKAAPLWRVDMVATAPACRRRGLMKKLMGQLLKDADGANADIILGTTSKRNRASYEKRGFVVVEASRVHWKEWYVWAARLTSGNASDEEEKVRTNGQKVKQNRGDDAVNVARIITRCRHF
jgi:GNAT superfamily N-acetyltransferase